MDESPLTIEQVLQALEQQGLQLSERTFRYYAMFGLLPTADKPEGKVDSRCQFYPPSSVEKLLTIRRLQEEGYSLKQIKQALAGRTATHDASAPPQAASGEAVGLLKAMADTALAGALSAIRSSSDEPSFRQAVLEYYRKILDSTVGPASMDQAIQQLSPLEIQGLMRPFRPLRREQAPAGHLPPWLRDLRSDHVDGKSWLLHLRQVGNRLEMHPAPESAPLRPVWRGLLDAVRQGETLWTRRLRGEQIAEAEVDSLERQLRATYAWLKSSRTLANTRGYRMVEEEP